MSNIERRYAYLDEGTFPEEGEYGVTYLTLYSSNAGNTYDGWVYDPDNKIEESLVERTYGYRNPDYPQYCWDDEVTVDLSNAQNRQESSEFEQGRITSFNTNVSSRPIILEDIDITGLTEEEREERATVVLFSAIPLVQDAYIQAHIEVQCKVNLSPDNTTGIVRVEAFYILNDESDRTMRPNPVHTFSVSSLNERHTLPWMYWNPALRHEDHNYIGVKLIATGGTVEIGISDDPDYGDAMITLASAGLTGDRIDDGKPIYLEIFGKEEVVGGYVLNPDDYTVLCTYDTGEIYDVTRICEFNPAMGTPIVDAVTTLTASYMGLHASMTIYLGMVESIELIGLNTFHSTLTLEMINYTVLAYLDSGDIMEVTAECTFSPAMGTVINSNTTLTATYEPYWMPGQTFTSSIEIEKVGSLIISAGQTGGLSYSLYNDGPDTPGYIEITGTSVHTDAYGDKWYEYIQIPSELISEMRDNSIEYYNLEWNASGKICGVLLPALWSPSLNVKKGFLSRIINFDDVEIVPEYDKTSRTIPYENPIYINFYYNETVTSEKLSFFRNIDMRDVAEGRLTVLKKSTGSNGLAEVFEGCKQLDNLDFLENIDVSRVEQANGLFKGCSGLSDISGIKNWDTSNFIYVHEMFSGCSSLENASDLYKWYLPKVYTVGSMFADSGLTTLSGLGNIKIGELNSYSGRVTFLYMFSGCTKLKRLNGSEKLINHHAVNIEGMFYGCTDLEDISAASHWITSNITNMVSVFNGCTKLSNISALSNWDTSEVADMRNIFADCPINNDGYINNWNVLKVEKFHRMFYYDVNDLENTEWYGSSLIWPDNQSYLLSDFRLTLLPYGNNPTEDRISIFRLHSDKWKEDNNYPYYVTNSGMYSGRDVFRMILSGSGATRHVESFQMLYEVPWWYRTLLEQKIMNLKFVASDIYPN